MDTIKQLNLFKDLSAYQIHFVPFLDLRVHCCDTNFLDFNGHSEDRFFFKLSWFF